MKRHCAVLAVLLLASALQAQKIRAGQELPNAKRGVDYPLTLHVYGIHIRPECEKGYCVNSIFADVTVNGQKKLELRGSSGVPDKPYAGIASLIHLGDFRARVLKNGGGMELGDEYELVLPDDRVLEFVVTGMME